MDAIVTDAPVCYLCREPCLNRQRDRRGRPAHYLCQLRALDPPDRHERLPTYPRVPNYPDADDGGVNPP
jgi:hypothetical protein